MNRDVCDLVRQFRRRAQTIEEFRVTLGELAEAAKLNMAEDWEAITADLWANKQSCTCQTREVLCPCCPGVQAAADGGECFCGLFVGHE